MRVLLLFSLVSLFGIAHAQQYPLLHYTTQNGLSQMQVMSTFKDSRGYLWVGTKYGFCKFNGERFEHFAPDFSTVGNEVSGFAEDNKGYIYILSLPFSLTRFDGQKFIQIKRPQVEFQQLCSDNQNQVFCRNDATGELNVVVNDSLVAVNWPSLKNRKLLWITYDKPTRSLIGNVDSLGLVQITQKKLTLLIKNPSLSQSNDAWLRSRSGKAVIHRQSSSEELFFSEFGVGNWQPFLKITKGKCDVLRTVSFDWLFNCDGHTRLLEANSKRVTSVFSAFFNNSTATTYGTWIGTEKGLVFIVQNGFRYFHEDKVPNAWSVVEDSQQRMWFLNYLNPIQRFDGQKIEVIKGYQEAMIRQLQAANVPNAPANQDGWYYGALRDKKGSLWMPNAHGVLWYDSKRFEFLVRPAPTQPSSITFSLLEDPERNVVLQGSKGVVHIFENQPPFQTTSLTKKEGLNIKSYVFSMALERSGVYWFGGARMLSQYDAIRKQWKEYSLSNKKLNAIGLFDLEFDDRGTLWLASFNQGLSYLDARRDTVRRVESLEFREPVYSVIQFDNDHLLIGSLRNLYVMDLKAWYASKKVVLKCFNHHNGFIGIEPGQSGLYKDSRGHIWITSGSVLSVIDPKKLDLRPGQLCTYITKLNSRRLPFEQLAKDSIFALPFGTGDVRAEFESVGDDKPFRSQYSYYVEGLTDGWTPWQEEPTASLTHLASGSYTLRVKSRMGGTETRNNKEATIRFTVRVWPWQSPYFPYYASALLMLGVGYFLYYRWQNNRKQQQAEAERQQAQRQIEKAELKRQQAQLQAEKAEAEILQQTQAIKVLEVQTAQAQMNPHFIFNVLGTLQSLVYYNETAKANENIVKFGHLMRSYLSASLSLDGTRESLERGMITLEQEIKLLQMYIDFEQLQYRDRFEAHIHVSPDLSPDFYRILPLLIQPFVENAIKHGVLPNSSQKGKVWVRFWLEEDETLVCQIEDNGIGRTASSQLKKEAIQTHRSEGTNLVRKRAELLKQLNYFIDIQTTDRSEGGTSVLVKIIDKYDEL